MAWHFGSGGLPSLRGRASRCPDLQGLCRIFLPLRRPAGASNRRSAGLAASYYAFGQAFFPGEQGAAAVLSVSLLTDLPGPDKGVMLPATSSTPIVSREACTTMKFENKPLAVAAIVASSLLGLTACGAQAPSSTATGDPIVVASVNALSGAASFPEASQAAKAVFDEFNDAGGLDGRMIEYTILDDKADPATAAPASAREVVAEPRVGSARRVGEPARLRDQRRVLRAAGHPLSIQGTGVDQVCFDNANISPVNVGPFGDTGR